MNRNIDVVSACPACGRVACMQCFSDVGEILRTFNSHTPEVQANLDLADAALKYLGEKARVKNDLLGQRLVSHGRANLALVQRRVSGLSLFLQIVAACCILAITFGLGMKLVDKEYKDLMQVSGCGNAIRE